MNVQPFPTDKNDIKTASGVLSPTKPSVFIQNDVLVSNINGSLRFQNDVLVSNINGSLRCPPFKISRA
jgi:hypothetical protein